jgi:hypothetical protein
MNTVVWGIGLVLVMPILVFAAYPQELGLMMWVVLALAALVALLILWLKDFMRWAVKKRGPQ